MAEQNLFGFPGDLPPSLAMLQLIAGKWVMQAIYVAAEVGIADLLKDGARPSAEIARACGTNEDATYRLMRAPANVAVLAESEGHTFALTPLGETLREGERV